MSGEIFDFLKTYDIQLDDGSGDMEYNVCNIVYEQEEDNQNNEEEDEFG